MLTIAELSKKLNVNVQKIYRLLNSVKQNEKECLIKKNNGITYLTPKGEQFVSERLTDVKQGENEEMLFLREEIKKLQEDLTKEREHSRTITTQLLELTKNSQELTRNSQILLKQEQEKNTLMLSDGQQSTNSENEKQSKNSLWQKLFKKK